MRTSFHHQSEAQPPNGPLTAASSPDTPSHHPSHAVGLCGAIPGLRKLLVAAFPDVRLEDVGEAPRAFRPRSGAASSHSVFVVESFMDELAAAKQGPVAYRLALADLPVPRKARAPADAALKSA
jgi:hypothetical protein